MNLYLWLARPPRVPQRSGYWTNKSKKCDGSDSWCHLLSWQPSSPGKDHSEGPLRGNLNTADVRKITRLEKMAANRQSKLASGVNLIIQNTDLR